MLVLVATLGTQGDLLPYLAICRQLAARGHEPVIASSETHREAIEARGFAFRPVRPHVDPDDQELFERVMHPRRGPEFGLREILLPSLRESYEDTLAAARDADAIVTHPIAFAGPLVAEATGRPWISTALAPISFASRHELPALPVAPRLKRLERIPGARPLLWRLFRRVTRSWSEPIRALRAELGLASAADPLLGGHHSPLRALGLFSPAFAPPMPDWPASARLTGFPFDDAPPTDDAESRRLERFLAAGPAPVVFTLGTSVVRVRSRFYAESLAAARKLGLRAVLLVGDEPGNRPAEDLDGDAIAVARAPYHELFPRAQAIVHHGGIGTTGQALRGGRPMLVVPRSHDQPDNAIRAQRLGVARVLLPPWPYRARRAARELRRLLEDPARAERAAEVGAIVRAEDGASAAAEAIEAAARAG